MRDVANPHSIRNALLTLCLVSTMTVATPATSVIVSSNRLVAKVGSSLVTNEGRGLDRAAVADWAAQIAALHQQGKQVVLVSSGAIAEGMARLGWAKRPSAMHELQAAAAVGQIKAGLSRPDTKHVGPAFPEEPVAISDPGQYGERPRRQTPPIRPYG